MYRNSQGKKRIYEMGSAYRGSLVAYDGYAFPPQRIQVEVQALTTQDGLTSLRAGDLVPEFVVGIENNLFVIRFADLFALVVFLLDPAGKNQNQQNTFQAQKLCVL